MNDKQMLIEAQMHLESINEAFLDLDATMRQLIGTDGMESVDILWHEVNSRIWAAILLVQSVRNGKPSEQLAELLLEANAFNRDDDGPSGQH